MEDIKKTDKNKSQDNYFESSIDLISSKSESDNIECFNFYYFNLKPVPYRMKIQLTTKKTAQSDFLMKEQFNKDKTINDEEISSLKSMKLINTIKPKIDIYNINQDDINYKSNFMLNIVKYAESVGYSNIGFLLPLIQEVTFQDPKVIKSFLSIFDKLLEYLLSNNDGYKIVITKIIPMMEELFNKNLTKDNDLKELSKKALVTLSKCLTKDDLASRILPIIIVLAQNEKSSNYQLISMEIFNDLANIMGKDLCEAYVVPQIYSFSSDSNDEIRMCIIKNMMHICECISYECFSERIIPIYEVISNDSYWPIRKNACEIIASLAKISKQELVSSKLLPIYLKFIKDKEKIIIDIALRIFGEFIFYLSKEDIDNNEILFKFYIDNLLKLYNNKTFNSDTTTIYSCAFSFPSVLSIYKKEKWNELKVIYEKFTTDNESRIKITITKSIAEVGKILGTELSEKELAPILINFYEKNGEIIKNSVIGVLPEYLKTIEDDEIKMKFLNFFKEMITLSLKWRQKIFIVKLLGELNTIYNEDILYNNIFPSILRLCFDDALKVRKKSCNKLSNLIIKLISHDNKYKDNVLKIVNSFATCIHYNYRQLFIGNICKQLIKDKQIFEGNKIIDSFFDLAFDKISNVRYTLAMFINKKYNKIEWMKSDEKILLIIYILKNDQCKYVSECLNEINIDFNNEDLVKTEKEKHKNINLTFNNNMNFIKENFKFDFLNFGKVKNNHKQEEEDDKGNDIIENKDIN